MTAASPILTIHVHLTGTFFLEGHTKNICMLPFDGTAEGPYFSGKIIGTGTDTQKIEKSGQAVLSARYMLEGIDCENNPCKIFIENNGTDMAKCTPTLITNSPVLAKFETMALTSSVVPAEGGVTVYIYAP